MNVLGLADAPYESLRPELRGALSEYYRVDDMNSYDALVRALGHFTHRHGKLDGIDSHSEHWLETEARLRTDFNMAGLRQDRIGIVKRKSSMKEIYRSAGIRVARGAVVRTLEEARRLVAETGYPVVAKPDVGVGAAATFKIRDDGELSSFFDREAAGGLHRGGVHPGKNLLLRRAGGPRRQPRLLHRRTPSARGSWRRSTRTTDLFYYSLREIPADLEDAGTAHGAGLRRPGAVLPLRVLPGRPGRRDRRPRGEPAAAGGLDHGHVQLRQRHRHLPGVGARGGPQPVHGGLVPPVPCRLRRPEAGEAVRPRSTRRSLRPSGASSCHHEEIDSIFRAAIGDYGYLVRSKDLDEVLAAARYIQETA